MDDLDPGSATPGSRAFALWRSLAGSRRRWVAAILAVNLVAVLMMAGLGAARTRQSCGGGGSGYSGVGSGYSGGGSGCCGSFANLLGNSGFESPVAASSGYPAPITLGNWLPFDTGYGIPAVTSSPTYCGISAGQVIGGYWVQDLPIPSDPGHPRELFNPAHPFEFSFWFYPHATKSQVSLVTKWDRGAGRSHFVISMSLTGKVGNGFQTLTVVSGIDTPGPNPVVSANAWHHFDAFSFGVNGQVRLFMDGAEFGPAPFGSTAPKGRATVLMGDTRGGSHPAVYDEVYLGPPLGGTTTQINSSLNPSAPGQSVTYTTTVSPAPPFTGVPTGTVDFQDAGVGIVGCQAVPLTNASANCTVTYPSPQYHSIVAAYSGDANFPGSSGTLGEMMIGTNHTNTFQSGYMLDAPTGVSYTAVEATFTVPTVDAASGCPNSMDPCRKSSTWVGIANETNNLVQAGTGADLYQDGHASYRAWTEVLPNPEVGLNMTISPGDLIMAIVKETAPNSWRMEVDDLTTGVSRGRNVTYTSDHSSAEAVHEATNNAPLTQTTDVVFDPVYYAISAPSPNPAWTPLFQAPGSATVEYLVMSGADGSVATPSPVDTDNDGFQIADGTTAPPMPPT